VIPCVASTHLLTTNCILHLSRPLFYTFGFLEQLNGNSVDDHLSPALAVSMFMLYGTWI
jgi:hypothetical protein